MAKAGSNRDPSMHLAVDGCSHDPQVPLDQKVMYLFSAVAKKLELARWVEGDCQTLAATESLVPAAPDSKFRRHLSAPAKDCFGLSPGFGPAAVGLHQPVSEVA